MNAIAFMTANYVAREAGYAMHGWGHGDRTTNDAFAPLASYEARFETLCGDVRALGFRTVDVWGAHLNPDWATDEHVSIARSVLARNGLEVSTYATWIGPSNVERSCELAAGLGTNVIGGGCSGDRTRVAAILRERGLRLGIENHPERTPQEVVEQIGDDGDVLGATIDTGWWGTQDYDAARAIEELGDRIFHVHLKDVRAVGEPHETCRWGDGIVDVEGCVRALRRIGYRGALAVEHEPEDSDPTEDVRAMRAQLEGWLA